MVYHHDEDHDEDHEDHETYLTDAKGWWALARRFHRAEVC